MEQSDIVQDEQPGTPAQSRETFGQKLLRHTKLWLQGWFELLVFFPFILVVVALLLPGSESMWLWLGSLPLFYLIGMGVRLLLGVQNILYLGGLFLPIAALIAYFVSGGINGASVILFIVGVIALFRGNLFVGAVWTDIFPAHFYIAGPISYFFTYLLFRWIEKLEPYSSLLAWAGAINLILTILMSNTMMIKSVSFLGNKKSASSSIVRHNRVYIFVILVLAVLISSYSTLKDWFLGIISDFVHWVYAMIQAFIEWFSSPELPTEQPPIETPPAFPGDLGSETNPSDKLTLYILMAVLALAAIGLLWLLVRTIIRHGPAWWAAIAEFLQRIVRTRREEGDKNLYIDEKQRLNIWDGLTRAYRDRLKEWVERLMAREPRWGDLTTNNERIRYLYRHYLLKRIAAGYALKGSYTPQETARDLADKTSARGGNIADSTDSIDSTGKLAQLYGRARYGKGEVSDNDVETMKRLKDEAGK